MQRSKVLALIFLVGTLVAGGAAGFTIDRLLVRDACGNTSDRGSLRRALAERLALTPAQRVAVDSILDKRHRDIDAVFAPIRPQLDSLRASADSIRRAARADIFKVLDAEQSREFQRMIDESRRERERDRERDNQEKNRT